MAASLLDKVDVDQTNIFNKGGQMNLICATSDFTRVGN